ncbi:uncharacterized protein LOC142356574 [Convolutriloba macropyga]|uniref:uncharacterized protein LOC142356574 n=1 Tax=Convolutriloba macropyga TaxID=536237 RepID=UPI003F51C062
MDSPYNNAASEIIPGPFNCYAITTKPDFTKIMLEVDASFMTCFLKDTTATVSSNCVQLAFDEARRNALGYVAYQASSSSDVRCAAHTADKGGLGFTISDALKHPTCVFGTYISIVVNNPSDHVWCGDGGAIEREREESVVKYGGG